VGKGEAVEQLHKFSTSVTEEGEYSISRHENSTTRAMMAVLDMRLHVPLSVLKSDYLAVLVFEPQIPISYS
jgi:hypothetical protein